MARAPKTKEMPMVEGLIEDCIKQGIAETPSEVFSKAFKLPGKILPKS
jgi:hypothetical protein